MADRKISQFTALAKADVVIGSDYLPIVDVSAAAADKNKRILVENLVKSVTDVLTRLHVEGDITTGVTMVLGSNVYYSGGWKYKANGNGYALYTAADVMRLSTFPTNAGGPDAAATEDIIFTVNTTSKVGYIGNDYIVNGVFTVSTGHILPVNAESLSATKALTIADKTYQFLNPNGSARDVTLPNTNSNYSFVIKNTGTAGNALTVKDSAAATIMTVYNGETFTFVQIGANSWTTL